MKFSLLAWIKEYSPRCTYNLSLSGLPEPDLEEFSINTNYKDFLDIIGSGDDPEEMFRRELGRVYSLDRDLVLPTVGGSEAIQLVFLKLAAKTRSVLVPKPNYEPMFLVPRAMGLEVLSEQDPKHGLAVALTDINNPTGRSVPDSVFREYIDSKNPNLVYVDETFKEFAAGDSSYTRFTKGHPIITSGSMSKFYGISKLRIGWIFAEYEVIEELRDLSRLVRGENNAYSLWISAQAISKRSEFARRARSIYVRNRELVRQFVEGSNLVWSEPEGAPICLISYKGKERSEILCRRIFDRTGVLVAPGEYFGDEFSFRLCFTHNKPSILEEALHRLSSFFRSVEL
jgi:aspartate/methionine/tyrosine aminotransferase